MKGYKVQFGGRGEYRKPAPIAIDQPASGMPFDLEGALNHARQLLLEGKPDVAIYDGDGRSISGNDLVACCNGARKLTADLRAIDIDGAQSGG